MDLAKISSELLEIEDQAVNGVPPADRDARWTELTMELIRRLRGPDGERRRWTRIPLPDTELTLEVNGRQTAANTRSGNMSNGGVTVWIAPDALDAQADRIRLTGIRFRGHSYVQDVGCQVVWSHDWSDARHVGLRFSQMTPQTRARFFPCYYQAYREFLAHLASEQ